MTAFGFHTGMLGQWTAQQSEEPELPPCNVEQSEQAAGWRRGRRSQESLAGDSQLSLRAYRRESSPEVREQQKIFVRASSQD